MKGILGTTLIVCILGALSIGVSKYRTLDGAMRLLVWYLFLQLMGEIAMVLTAAESRLYLRAILSNVYIILEMCLMSGFYITAINPYRPKKLLLLSSIFWILLGISNMMFLQSPNTLNSNMLLIECFAVICMSLYTIYSIVTSTAVSNLFSVPYFRVSLIWLFMCSSSMFFWAFIKVLYQEHWKFANLVMHTQVVLNCLLVIAMGSVFYFYPKKHTRENV
jgi:hypothetical protein